MIADVRGYTTYTREKGDEAAADLAAKFAAIVRSVSQGLSGQLLELRGDEALVVFVSARQAVRAAIRLQEAFAEENLPRGVGIGLDAGEAIPVEDGFRGGALNLAARLCAQAAAGEVMATETVIHLAAHVDGITYVEPRTLRLKGYVDPVRVVQVVSSDHVPSRMSRRVRRVRSRVKADRRVQVGIAAILVAALLAVFLPNMLHGASSVVRPGVALLDAGSGSVLTQIPVHDPVEAIFAEGSFWVLSLNPISFTQIDPKTRRVVKEIRSPVDDVGWFTVHGDDLWVTDHAGPTLVRTSVRLGREVQRFTISDEPNGAGGVAFGAGFLWIGSPDNSAVLQVDPGNGVVKKRIPGVIGPVALGFGDGQVWSVAFDMPGLVRIDPTSGAVAARARIDGPHNSVAVGGGYAWTSDERKGNVYKVDPRGNVVATYETGEGARPLWYSDGAVWVANQDAGTITSIDAVTGARRSIRIGHPVQTVVAGAGVVLAVASPGLTYEDTIDRLKGDVARLLVPSGIDSPDPAAEQGFLNSQIAFATCAKLVNYPDANAPHGEALRPEIATAMPTLSKDRRTYTFAVGVGYRFSPPSDEKVTAETFRYSIERALSPRLKEDAPGIRFLGDIQGAEAFHAGKAGVDHISGIQASGDRLTITLVKPSPDFLLRLAMPFFCPVPLDTPIAADYNLAPPSAGPYYMTADSNGEFIILKRNPNYGGSRPVHFDAIAIREGLDLGRGIQGVTAGRWDYITDFDPLIGLGSEIDRKWGASSASATKGDRRYYYTPLGNADYLVFNESRPLFRDVRTRREVARALNRATLAAPFDEAPEDRLLSDVMPEVAGGHAYPLTASSITPVARPRRTARMATRKGCDQCKDFNDALKAQLAGIGIDVIIDELDDPDVAFHQQRAKYDLLNGFTVIDYPDGATFLRKMLLEDAPEGWIPSSIRSAVEELDHRDGGDRQRAAIVLSQKLLRRDVPIAVFGAVGIREFFSKRLGCRIFPPFGFGVDIAALCIR